MTTTENERQLRSDAVVRRFGSIAELLPSAANPSPLVRLNRVDPSQRVETYLKLEWLNPFGSVKDRAAAAMISGLAERGQLNGRSIIEASSGNTAIALAGLAALSGVRVTATVPDGVPDEKKVILRMLGADVWETPDDVCPVDHPKDGAIALARAMAASVGGARFAHTDQYENADNARAHYETTGPEIWRQTDGQVGVFVAGYGTAGTISGVGRYLKERDPDIRIVAVEPEPGHRLPGLKSLKEAKAPGILDRSVIDQVVIVDDESAYGMTRELWRKEGLMVGPSTGAVVAGASTLETAPDDVIVGISADSGTRYISYFEEILGDEGKPPV